MSSKSCLKVWRRQKTILVSIHDAKSLLELLDGRVGEGLEDVGFLGHLDTGCGLWNNYCFGIKHIYTFQFQRFSIPWVFALEVETTYTAADLTMGVTVRLPYCSTRDRKQSSWLSPAFHDPKDRTATSQVWTLIVLQATAGSGMWWIIEYLLGNHFYLIFLDSYLTLILFSIECLSSFVCNNIMRGNMSTGNGMELGKISHSSANFCSFCYSVYQSFDFGIGLRFIRFFL